MVYSQATPFNLQYIIYKLSQNLAIVVLEVSVNCTFVAFVDLKVMIKTMMNVQFVL